MLNFKKLFLPIAALTILILGLSGIVSAQYHAGAATTTVGVQPQLFNGNFVAESNDQVCYEICQLLECSVTSEMIGIKVDPPVNFNNGDISTTISADGRFLNWTALNGTELLYFIIKGGPAFNLYDYESVTGFPFPSDTGLHSPGTFNKKRQLVYPQISHYNACYIPVDDDDTTTGCTIGYWRNHANRWAVATINDDFDTTFGVNLFDPDRTLGQAIVSQGGGGANQLGAQATAALLNSYGGVPNDDGTSVNSYPYTTADVILIVQNAVNTVDDPNTGADERAQAISAAAALFDTANNLGCPLGGTNACKVEDFPCS